LHAYVGAEPDLQQVLLDSTIVRAHACAAGATESTAERQALGRSRGGFITKFHALTDALGYPVRLTLTPGQDSDITQAGNVLEGIQAEPAIADKAYDANAFIQTLGARGTTPVIPPRSNRTTPRYCDGYVYKERHLIECFFGKIKHYGRVLSRFEKKALNYLAFVQFSAFLVWTR
jgi:transposase